MTTLVGASVFVALLLAVHLFLDRTLWKDYKQVKARSAIGAVVVLLAMAAWPLGMALLGLHEGMIECLGRSCHDAVYSRAANPVPYWFQVSLLFTLGAPLLSLAVKSSWLLARSWKQLPWRTPLAGLSAPELRASDQALEQEQATVIDAGLRRMDGGGKIADALKPISHQRAQIAIELRQRERIRQSLRLPLISCGVLVLGVVLIVAILVLFGPFLVAH